MIAIAPNSCRAPQLTRTQNNWQDRFLLLPKIHLIARCAFRKLPSGVEPIRESDGAKWSSLMKA